MSGKAARLRQIRELILAGPIESQDRLQVALREQGIEVTQATLSRDLRELGVLKGPDGYVLAGPDERRARSPDGLRRAMSEFAAAVSHGGTLVVVRTGPGQASALALELDRAGLAGVLGTVAGDDTVFIATGTAQEAGTLARELSDR